MDSAPFSPRRAALWMSLAALAAYLLTASGHLYSPDEEVLYRGVESLLADGDLAIDPIDPTGFATSRGPDGGQYPQYGVGQMLLALPFCAAGKLAAPLLSDSTWARLYGLRPGSPYPGFKPVAAEIAPRFACSLFNVVLSAAFAGLMVLLLWEVTGHAPSSILGTALYAFGSMAWPHSRPFFTETGAVFFMVLAWWAALRARGPGMSRWAALSGAAAGFAALTRMDSIFMYPGLGLFLLGPIRIEAARIRPRVHPYIAFCLPATACGGVLLLLNVIRFGGPFATGYSDQPEGVQFSTPILAGLYGLLFSAGKGLFFFSPALALSIWAWGDLKRRGAWLTAGVALSVALPLAAMAKWQNWAGGWCWGPRHIVMIHPFLAIPIACWLAEQWGPGRRVAALAALAAGAAVQIFGCSQDFMEFHRIFYRDPRAAFRVMYDDFDQEYWRPYFKTEGRPDTAEAWRPLELRHLPAPIHHSLYLPPSSVWNGYPVMWRRFGLVDNLWLRLLRD